MAYGTRTAQATGSVDVGSYLGMRVTVFTTCCLCDAAWERESNGAESVLYARDAGARELERLGWRVGYNRQRGRLGMVCKTCAALPETVTTFDL